MSKAYLGDGAYVEFDGFALVLTAEDGVRVTNRVVLEPAVYAALVEYVAKLKRPQNKALDAFGWEKVSEGA